MQSVDSMTQSVHMQSVDSITQNVHMCSCRVFMQSVGTRVFMQSVDLMLVLLQNGGKDCTGPSQHQMRLAMLMAKKQAPQEGGSAGRGRGRLQLKLPDIKPDWDERAYRCKEVQLKANLHTLVYGQSMLQYENLQHLLSSLPMDKSALPGKHWTDDAGWEMAEAWDEVRA